MSNDAIGLTHVKWCKWSVWRVMWCEQSVLIVQPDDSIWISTTHCEFIHAWLLHCGLGKFREKWVGGLSFPITKKKKKGRRKTTVFFFPFFLLLVTSSTCCMVRLGGYGVFINSVLLSVCPFYHVGRNRCVQSAVLFIAQTRPRNSLPKQPLSCVVSLILLLWIGSPYVVTHQRPGVLLCCV